jgi:hypothetical protein
MSPTHCSTRNEKRHPGQDAARLAHVRGKAPCVPHANLPSRPRFPTTTFSGHAVAMAGHDHSRPNVGRGWVATTTFSGHAVAMAGHDHSRPNVGRGWVAVERRSVAQAVSRTSVCPARGFARLERGGVAVGAKDIAEDVAELLLRRVGAGSGNQRREEIRR